LLYTNENGFGVVGLQTDDTLVLANKSFAEAKESELNKANFLAKDREQLTFITLIKFNSSQIKLENDGLICLTQERHCQHLRLIALKAINLTSLREEVRQAVTLKD
jgi:hypothetical protein